jgi:anti-sigma B factor antagonist
VALVQHPRMPLRIGTHQLGGRTVVIPVGEVDLATSGVLRDCLARCDGDLIVDLAGVTFLDSSGIGALCGQRARLLQGGGSLELRDPTYQVRKAIETVGLADWIVN